MTDPPVKIVKCPHVLGSWASKKKIEMQHFLRENRKKILSRSNEQQQNGARNQPEKETQPFPLRKTNAS